VGIKGLKLMIRQNPARKQRKDVFIYSHVGKIYDKQQRTRHTLATVHNPCNITNIITAASVSLAS